MGTSSVNSAVSQSLPPFVILPVLLLLSSGSVECSKLAPPTPWKGSSLLKKIGRPTVAPFQKYMLSRNTSACAH